jgi:hypothetical protein
MFHGGRFAVHAGNANVRNAKSHSNQPPGHPVQPHAVNAALGTVQAFKPMAGILLFFSPGGG